jgi:hypothetical protein
MSDNFIQENADIITLRAMANVFMPEALDPVGQEDDDVDNDGDSDKSDEYLKKRRKAVGSAIDKRKKKLKEAAAAHTSDEDEEEIIEKKVKNKVVINPEMKESKDYDPMEDDEFDHDEAEENRGVSGKNNPKGGKRLYKKREVKKEEVEQVDEVAPLVVAGLAAAAATPYLMKRFGKPAADRALDNATKNSNLPLSTGGSTADLRKAKQAAGMQVNSYEPEGEIVDERYKGSKHRPPAGWKPYGGYEKGPVEVDATAKRIKAIKDSIKTKKED